MTERELILSYFALFDTSAVAPRDVLERLAEVHSCPSWGDVFMRLCAEGLIVRREYNYKLSDNVFSIAPQEMVKRIMWLYDTDEGHTVLDTMRPLYERLMMQQNTMQAIVTDYVKSKYKDTVAARNIFRTDLPYFIPVCDDERFVPMLSRVAEGAFINLVKDTVDDAYNHCRLLDMGVMHKLCDSYPYSDDLFRWRIAAMLDLYEYLAYGRIDEKAKRYARVPETHLLSACHETFNGHYQSALQHFAEAQRLYNAKTSIFELRGIFPQKLFNVILALTHARIDTGESNRQLDIMIKRASNPSILLAQLAAKIVRNTDAADIGEQMRECFSQGDEMTRQWIVLLKRFTGRNDVLSERMLNSVKPTWAVMLHEFGEKSLLMGIHRQEPWESTLNALLSKVNGALPEAGAVPQRNERIAYYIDSIDEDLATIKLQSVMKSGAWSVGKAVNYHQFMTMPMSMLEQGDMFIRDRNQNLGYINDYKLTLTSILPEMTRQSRLYVGKYSPYTLVEVNEEVPYLVVEQVEGGFNVTSNLRPQDLDENIIVTSRGASTINFLRLSDSLRPFFFNLLSIGFFPDAAEARLRELLAALGRRVEIHSPLIKGGTTLQTVEGTARLTLQMRPKGKEAYHCKLFCRPFDEGRAICCPGEGSETLITATTTGRGELERVQRVCVKRNLENERRNLEALHDALPDMPEGLEFETDAYGLLPIIDYLREHSDQVQMEWPEGHKLRVKRRTMQSQWRATLKKNQNGWFELDAQLQLDEGVYMSMQQLLGLMESHRSRYVKMGEGEFVALSEQLRKQLSAIGALATRSRSKLQMSLFTAALLDSTITDGELKIEMDEELALTRKRIEELSEYRAPVPKTLKAKLRAYQKEGYEWIARLNAWGAGALLADDMGLGKTVQTTAFLLHKASEGPQLVVAPASVAPNWKSELERFAPSLNVEILNFAPNRSRCIAEAAAGDVIITTYTLLLSVKEEITQKEWTTVCLDEAHVIKNRGAKTSGVCMKLKAANRIMLTGTPVQNHLGELWNLFQFVNPGLLGSYEDYGRRFITPIETAHNEERQAELERIVKPFMLRRTKETVLAELPEKTEIRQTVRLSDEEMAVYEVIRQRAEQMLLAEEREDRVSLNTLAEITRLRQAACSAALIDKQWKGKSSKVEALLEALEPVLESGDAALVFSQFTSFLDIVRSQLDRARVPYLYIDGAVPVKERVQLVEAFQKGECRLFLISLKAGGLGLNLTRANYVFHLDPWWNPAIEQQATDRAHRIGQQNAVTVYHLLAANTIEEKILMMHERKRDLAESILAGTDASGKLTGKDLMQMVRR